MGIRAFHKLTICLVLIGSGSQIHAQDCGVIEQQSLGTSYKEALTALTSIGCLGADRQQDHQLVKNFDLLTEDVGLATAQRIANTKAANGELLDFARDMAVSAVADRDYWSQIALVLSGQSIAMEQADIAESPGDASEIVASAIIPDSWEIQGSGAVEAISNRSVFDGLDPLCPASASAEGPQCSAYVNRKDMIVVISLAKDLAGYSTRERLYEHLAESRIANKKWAAYFDDARFQWWWEVWANGLAMVKSGDCDEDKTTVMREGFCSVPDSQMILFHPDIALSYVDGAESSDEMKGVFMVELFGRNSWDWAEDGTMQNARGWSVVAVHTDLNAKSDWGYGLMYHYRNRYSFGLTSTEGEVGVLLSVDLSDKLFERKAKYKNYLQEAKKPSFWQGVFTED